MEETPNFGQNESLKPEEVGDGLEKVRIVPVEELIPDINKKGTQRIESVDYETDNFSTNYVDNFFEQHINLVLDDPELLGVLKEKTKGQILIDLGSSDATTGYTVSVLLGFKGYIGVDKFLGKSLKHRLGNVTMESIKERYLNMIGLDCFDAIKDKSLIDALKSRSAEVLSETQLIPASTVEEDMLTFLQRLPDDSVCVLTSGLNVINYNYSKEVAKELQRVISPAGMWMTFSSGMLSHGNMKNILGDTFGYDFDSENFSGVGFYVKE